MKKVRLDRLLVEKGFFPSGEKARGAVMAGWVEVDGRIESKPGKAFPPGVGIRVSRGQAYVGRGGDKLASALERFGISVSGKRCLDIGSSTGGFTDCLLKAGAKCVVAVDVGYGQMEMRLREDPRVILMERTNARYLKRSDLPYEPDLVTVDVSFISLGKIIPVVERLSGKGAGLVALVKPQFEAGRKDVGRGGVVRDAGVHAAVLGRVCAVCKDCGFSVEGISESPLKGPAGNREFFIYAVRG